MSTILFLTTFFIHLSFAPHEPGLVGKSFPKKCELSRELGTPRYKVARVFRGSGNSPDTTLVIFVHNEDIEKARLIALTRRLKEEYCEESTIGALIFDDENAAHRVTFLDSTRYLRVFERGRYFLNRKTKQEQLEFAPKAGGGFRDTVKIDLSNNTNE